ncbi:MAG: CotH kinase family protein [Anaerolineae bacterium]|nr:CotH kinase family protein [Anaerolineae bacterium]
MMNFWHSSFAHRWLPLLLLGLALGGVLLLGERLDRLPGASLAPSGQLPLTGWRRRLVASGQVLPSAVNGMVAPGFYPPPGVYEKSLRLELRPTDRRAAVVFTTDGTLPTAEVGTLYREPLYLEARYPGVTVIRAVQVLDGVAGPPATAVYVVGLNSRLPVLALTAEPDALWGSASGILANASFRGAEWERPVEVTYFEPEGTGSFAVPAGLRVHGDVPLQAPKQSLRLYFRAEYGSARLGYPLFPGHPDQPEVEQSYKRLLLEAGDRNGWWTLFRDQLVADTAASVGLPVAQGRFVHLFINGRSWGLYRLTERVDRFFLEDNYGFHAVDVVQEGRAQEGSDEGWDTLVSWATGHDLAEAEAFAYVASRLDLNNFMDFAALQLYFGFSPEDLFAVRDRGGPWRFVYGGSGQSFAQRAEEAPAALTHDASDFALLLRALLANDAFRSAFGVRTAMLLNTALAPEALTARCDALAATLASDIPYEEARWPALTPWEGNVAALRAFIAERPAVLRATFAASLGQGEPLAVRLAVEPPEGGEVFAEGEPLAEGRFFAGSEVAFTAVPFEGHAFEGWEGIAAPSSAPVLSWTVTAPLTLTARFRALAADDPALRPNDVLINELWINDNGTSYASLDGRPITGDWVELLVRRPATVDLRGWRLTDNDTKTGTEEGSLIFPQLTALAAVPRGTVILIVATENASNDAYFPADDLDPADGRLLFYVGNGTLDVTTDPGFGMGTQNEALTLLAPGPSADFGDDIGVDFVAEGAAVTPYSFGVLQDGVRFTSPFRWLGGDDGAFFTALTANDDGSRDWVVDPSACESGDAFCLDAVNQLTPGALNPGQRAFPTWVLWLGGGVLGLLAGIVLLRRR